MECRTGRTPYRTKALAAAAALAEGRTGEVKRCANCRQWHVYDRRPRGRHRDAG